MKASTYFKLLRPRQWLKNLMLFFPPFLGGSIMNHGVMMNGFIPFAAFCLASSSSYILNDICDIDRDRAHPDKKMRPLASGAVNTKAARFLVALLLSGSLILASSASRTLLVYIVIYFAVTTAYSLYLKNFPIIDIFCISSGFLLRLMAGGEVFKVPVSEWLFLSVFLLSIFLSTGKRLSEKQLLNDAHQNHRISLSAYPPGFLDGLLYITASAALVVYSLYVVNRHSQLLLYTVPLCAFGLFRYIFRVKSGRGGDPTDSLTKDIPLFTVGLLWAITVGWGIYG